MALLAGLLLPHLEIASRGRAWLPAAATLLSLGWLGLALFGPAGESAPRRESSVLYAFDADSGEASWLSFDASPSPWSEHFGFTDGVRSPFEVFHPLIRREVLYAEAPRVALAVPEIEVVAQSIDGDLRHWELRLLAGEGARGRVLWLEPAAALAAVRLAGREISWSEASEESGPVIVELPIAAPEEELALAVVGDANITVTVLEQYEGLPEVPGLAPRPPEEIAPPGLALVRSDVTLVRRSWNVP